MLQVLVSIQGLILNAKPYFNEPGYANTGGTKHGEESSLAYNERTFMYTLQTMVYSMRRPPKVRELSRNLYYHDMCLLCSFTNFFFVIINILSTECMGGYHVLAF